MLSTHDLDLALRSADRIWLLPDNGPLQSGAPEDLVLSGAFEAAFHSEGVTFDRESGSFRIHTEHKTQVTLIGDGINAIWTRRALERAGFIVEQTAQSNCGLRVEILVSDDTLTWQLWRDNSAHKFESIQELIIGLHTNHKQS